MAPIGTPEPRPLASGITSGAMPAHWCANHLPVRPMPHCTSSSISSQPRSSQMRRTSLQVLDRRRVDAAFALDHFEEDRDDVRVACARPARSPPMSFSGTRTKPSTSGPKPACTLGLPVADSVAIERPWKAFS